MARLLRAASPAIRPLLIAARQTRARLTEVGAFRWSELAEFEEGAAFVRSNLRRKARPRENVWVRVFAVDGRLRRLLGRLRRRRTRLALWDFARDDFVFLPGGTPRMRNAVLCCMTRLRKKCGLGRVALFGGAPNPALAAAASAIRARVLALLMSRPGLLLKAEDLAEAIAEAARPRRG